MKKFNIYIDFVGLDHITLFAQKLKERLQGIRQEIEVVLYTEINADIHNWELKTTEAIDNSNIVIPILTSDYLSFVSSNIEFKFDEIIDSRDKFLFPIYYTPSDWSSFNWIVKSKLVPSDNIPLSEYNANDQERILNELIKNISSIIIKYNSEGIDEQKRTTKKQKKNTIFISHDHDDADFAELLKLTLEKHNLIGWIDSERLKIGQDWREEIDEGINNSIATIVIMTPEARKSEYVTYEWAFAWGKQKKIFPLMLKQTQLHPRLESLQYLDFTNRVARPWDKLIESLKELL